MIAPALLIKILGFAAVGAVLVVGVPLIVKSEKEKADVARQEEIDKHKNISKFFASDKSWTMYEGEKISEKAIEDWTLSNKDKTAIATNWTAKLGSITNALFKKTQAENWAKTSGVCHLKIHQVSIEGAEPSIIYVPFLKSSLTQIPKLENKSQLTTTTTSATSTGWYVFDGAGQFLKITTQEKLVSDLEDLQKPNGWITALSSNGWNKKRAKDLLFFQKLYLKTIDRIKELNNSYTRSTTEKPIWSYGGC